MMSEEHEKKHSAVGPGLTCQAKTLLVVAKMKCDAGVLRAKGVYNVHPAFFCGHTHLWL